MANSKRIGGSYERAFSYDLSEWITGEKDTSICWRDKSSGSRHTIRNRSGKQVFGNGGDIYPTDPQYNWWFAKFYIDTKSYQDVNWIFCNPDNQKSNDILKQWIKTVAQCPIDKMPIMPCYIRNRTTPEMIIFPSEAIYSYRSETQFLVTIAEEMKFNINTTQFLKLKKEHKLSFKTVMKDEFFELNKHEQFYKDNESFRNEDCRTYISQIGLL